MRIVMSMRRILIMICIVYPVILLAQTPKLTESTEEDFKSCQRREVAFVKSEEIVKVDGTISVKTKRVQLVLKMILRRKIIGLTNTLVI